MKKIIYALHEAMQRLLKNEFYQNILSLFSGMLMARIFPAVFALAIVRIYSPEDFGIFVLYLTIASVLSIVSTGKFENAIILAESEEERRNVFWMAQKINTLVNLLAAVILVSYILLIDDFEKATVILLMLIPVYSFSFASVHLLRNVYISNKRFKRLSVLEVSRAVITGVLQCSFFLFPETGLFLGATFSQVVIYFWFSRGVHEVRKTRSIWFNAAEMQVFKRYINFPKFSVASEVFNFISSQLPVFIMKPFFGATMLGLYSFPHRYISTPVQLLSSSISQVYIWEARLLKNNQPDLGNLTLSLFKKQFLVGIIPFTILGLWGKPLFGFVFGAEWEYSGFLAQLIAPWLFAVMLISPLSSVLVVMEKQRISMWYNILLLLARFSSLLFGGFILNDIAWTIGMYSATGFLFFVILGIYSFQLSGVNLLSVARFVIKVIIITLVPLILLKLCLRFL